MPEYDINFIGHLCFDETIQDDGTRSLVTGGAALYGAIAAAKLGAKVALELKLAAKDMDAASILTENGVDVLPITSAETTQVEVSHPDPNNVDERRILTTKFAGLFNMDEVKLPAAAHVHLAGCNDHEYPLEFIRAIRPKCASLSVDMQSFVRNNDPETGEVSFRDDPDKVEVVSLMDRIKLDILEASLLCGTDDLKKAAGIIQGWGCNEVVITCSDGVLAQCGDESYFEKFSNRSTVGRTGRGDTTFGAYLASRVNRTVAESLKYAAALVSIKMETPGPFSGTVEDVQERMNAS